MKKICKRSVKFGVFAALLIIAAVTAALAFTFPGFGRVEEVKPVNGVVTIPLSTVNDGKAHFFALSEGGKELGFFIVKGNDGALHTAFNACDVCYPAKKGYVQQGDRMTCKNCGKKFPIVRIGADSEGGCNPSYLPARVDGKSVRIKVTDLKAGARLF